MGGPMKNLFRASVFSGIAATSAAFAQQGNIPELDREEFGDWVVQCFAGSTSIEDCQLYQRVTTGDGEFTAMVVTFSWNAEQGSFETELALPLGVLLSFPPLLSIGPEYTANLAWSRCTSDGCLVEGTPNANVYELLKSNTQASITVMHPTDGQVVIPVSLNGFNEALARIAPN